MKILLIDAYDSFVHTIYQYLLALHAEVTVVRTDHMDFAKIEAEQYDLIMMGPGPGHPTECGYVKLIHHFQGKIPLFGVCLGMQALAIAFGGQVVKAKHLMHGKTSQISHTNEGCFVGLPNPLTVTRYHSLIAKEDTLPSDLIITARSLDDHYIMGLRHRHLPIEGVQFHPESIGTEEGMALFQNAIILDQTPRR